MQDQSARKGTVLPLYQQISDDIKRKIEQGEYKYGTRIEGENELMQAYGVSRITVRRAITELCDEGLLIKKQGMGTFVEQRPITRLFSDVEGFSVSCEKQGLTPSYRLLQMSLVEGKEKERDFLGMKKEERFISTSRLLSASGMPFMQENCYFPCTERFQFILSANLEQPLYPILEAHGSMPASTCKRVLRMVRASKELAESMDLPVGEPMFYKVAYLIDEKGQPLCIEKSYMVGSRYVFYI